MAIIGQDLVQGEYWTPAINFTGGQKFYFDPSATARGDGSLSNPFLSFGSEVTAGDIIKRRDRFGAVVNPTAPVSQGDVCILLNGNHGEIAMTQYHNTDYMAIVGMPGHSPSFDSMVFRECKYFYIENLTGHERVRSSWPNPGSGYDGAPYFIQVRPDIHANRFSDHFIVKNCRLSTAPLNEADTWSDADWVEKAVGGFYSDRADYIHLQENTFEVVNYGATFALADFLNVFNNTVNYDSGDGFKLNSPGYAHLADNLLMEFFTVDENHVDMIQFFGSTHDIIVERNQCYEATDPSRVVDGIFAGIWFSGGGTDVEIRNNIVYANRYSAISLGLNSARVSIINNTVFGGNNAGATPVSWITFHGDAIDCCAKNNIAGRVYDGGFTGITLTKNLEFYRDFTGAGFVHWVEDGPPLQQNVCLTETSPAVDTGAGIGAPMEDFDRISRPKGSNSRYDIGAYEFPATPHERPIVDSH